ncbi:MAG: ATP-binding cassette domain-containing protein [Desulfarculus sp.]|nr:ATP-binding cassette domain-containing protein [Desulfarculus sp.]
MIEVRDLSKRFGATLAVDGLNFAVAAGEILGFLGPNGAGKTTTMRLLTGFFPPTSGAAFIAGHDVVEEPLAARRAVGYLPENVPLYVGMRVREYLDFVGAAKGLDKLAARREGMRVMEATGITARAGQLIKQLSKGFRQRVGLAQALLGDPPVLILDEPTIGLDPGQIVEIRGLIKGMAGQKTVIFSSHILGEVAAVCQRVVIIAQGRLVAQGPPSLLSPEAQARALRLVAQAAPERLAQVLAAVPGVLSQEPLALAAGQEGCAALRLTLASGPQVVAAVARAVVEAGLGLVELTPLSQSLEEVFVQLTRGEPGPAAPTQAETQA